MFFDKVLFADLETVPAFESFYLLDERGQQIYRKRFERELLQQNQGMVASNITDAQYNDHYVANAGFHAEWGKIVCVSVGSFNEVTPGELQVRIKHICSTEETTILKQVSDIVRSFNKMCAHNGKTFDIPFLSRRLLINKMPIPDKINSIGKKTWEIPTLDTMELWKFGDFAHRSSLDLLSYVFGLPSPKTDLTGADVYKVYYGVGKYADISIEERLQMIGTYCDGDIKALINVACYIYNQTPVEESDFILV